VSAERWEKKYAKHHYHFTGRCSTPNCALSAIKEAAISVRPLAEILTILSTKNIFMEETFTKTVSLNLQLWLVTKFEDEL
jgi:hypothetical protein